MGADDEREKSKKRKRKRRSAGGGGRKESSSTKERAADDALGNGDGDDAEGRKDDEESRARRRKEVRPKTEEGEGIVDEDGEGRKEASGPSPDVVGSECEKEVSDPSPDTIRSESNKDGEDEQDEPLAPAKKKRKRKRKKKKAVPEGSEGEASPGGVASGKEEKLTSMEHTVYVEGIPFDCSEDDVKHFFEENGCNDVLQMRLPRWQDSGRLRGYGHVVFDTVASRTTALKELNGLNLGRRYLTIREPNAPRPGTSAAASSGGVAPRTQPEGCRTVFVKNLPYESSEDDVALAFRPCGKIVDGGVRIARNYNTKQCKGFAYVEFKNPEGAYSAVQKAAKPFGMAVKGRPCFVDYDEGKMKGSYRTSEGKLWQKEHGSVHSTGRK